MIVPRDKDLSADTLAHQVRETACGWFRDPSGIDHSANHGVSIGSTLNYMIWHASASILRYSLQIESRGSPQMATGALLTGVRPTNLERESAAEYGVALRTAGVSSLVPRLDEQVISDRAIFVPFLAQLVRKTQLLYASQIRKRRQLWITDWTTYQVSRENSDAIVLYSRHPIRSAIPNVTTRDVSKAENLFTSGIDDLMNYDSLSSFLSGRNYAWPDGAIRLLSRYIQVRYLEIRRLLVLSAAQINNMLNFYQPSRVYLPADAYEVWNLWYQLCNHREIETVMYLDGYSVTPKFPILRTNDNQRLLVNKVKSYGSGQFEMYRRFGIPTQMIETTYPPFLKYSPKRKNGSEQFDAIVLTWTPQALNPLADTLSPATTLKLALKTLIGCGYKKIAVKIRWGGESHYVSRIVNEVDERIPILTGALRIHLQSSNLFVGGISTALAEVVGHHLRYVVFEPIENGYSDFEIAQAVVISRNSIARTSSELGDLLQRRESSWLGDPGRNLMS